MIEAVSKQDADVVEKILAKGVDVNKRDRFGRSPMDRAIALGANHLVKRLIKAGADLNKVGPGGVSFLEAAIRAEQPETAKTLLEAGAKPNPPGNRCADAHYMACAMGYVELLKLLIRKGSQPRGSGALISAARKKSVELMEILLEAGAEINEADESGWTPLSWAVFMPNVTYTIKKLSAGGTLLSAEAGSQTLDDTETVKAVKYLLDHGADPNPTNHLDRTPLTYARSLAIARLLIKSGARLGVRDKERHDARYWLKKNGIVLTPELSR